MNNKIENEGQMASADRCGGQSVSHAESELELDGVLDELRQLWDYRDARLESLSSSSTMQPVRINPRRGVSARRAFMAKTLVLVLVNLALSVCSLLTMTQSANRWVVAYGWGIVILGLGLAFHCYQAYESCRCKSLLQNVVIGASGGRQLGRGAVSHVSLGRVAALSVSIMIVVVFAACDPVGDGAAMTNVNRSVRVAALDNINNLLSQL